GAPRPLACALRLKAGPEHARRERHPSHLGRHLRRGHLQHRRGRDHRHQAERHRLDRRDRGRRLPAPRGRGQVLLPRLEGTGRRGHHPGGEARLRRRRTTDPPRAPTGPGRVLCSPARPHQPRHPYHPHRSHLHRPHRPHPHRRRRLDGSGLIRATPWVLDGENVPGAARRGAPRPGQCSSERGTIPAPRTPRTRRSSMVSPRRTTVSPPRGSRITRSVSITWRTPPRRSSVSSWASLSPRWRSCQRSTCPWIITTVGRGPRRVKTRPMPGRRLPRRYSSTSRVVTAISPPTRVGVLPRIARATRDPSSAITAKLSIDGLALSRGPATWRISAKTR